MLTENDLYEYIDFPEARRDISREDILNAFMSRISILEPKLHSLISVFDRDALFDEVRASSQGGKSRSLDGLVFSIKDNIDVAGLPCTVGSKLFEGVTPNKDAPVVSALRENGGMILSKANMHELVYGVTTDNPYFGRCRNPWGSEHTAGGSSGGSGSAIAADLCVASLGTDTGGSVRIPASFCGVSGLRPTLGRIDNRGMYFAAPSFDTIGPMARRVSDVKSVFIALSGLPTNKRSFVSRNLSNLVLPPPSSAALETKLRLGIPKAWFEKASHEVRNAVLEAAKVFLDLDVEVKEITLPDLDRAADAARILIRASATATNYKYLKEKRELISDDVASRLYIGEQTPGYMVAEAMDYREEWTYKVMDLLTDTCDFLLLPTTLTTAPTFSHLTDKDITDEITLSTYPWSLSRSPALSLPCGFDSSGMPIGMQLIAAPGRDELLLSLGEAYQEVTDWHRRRPNR